MSATTHTTIPTLQAPQTSLFYRFFFASRRRHTRYWRDWSSDVCSSDLGRGALAEARPIVDDGEAGRATRHDGEIDLAVRTDGADVVVMREQRARGVEFFAVEIGRASCRERV